MMTPHPNNRRKRALALAAAGAALVTGAMTTATAASASTTVSGSLSCVSGNAVEGVWVAANSSSSGWAILSAASGSASSVSWHYSLNNGGTYYIHVGCGGSPSHWATNNYSSTVSGNSLTGVICYDMTYEVPANYQYRCR
ncbi:hypothetical protein ACIRVK_32170 [Streptomyces sp. NPDC101152]|uniref:hypothetical protein n=1 Tax=Streptomyces sp. NPDC101152 TaxID=3366116 RepID=UPI0038246CDC